jgi:predicted AAA+ superfamily ATPase
MDWYCNTNAFMIIHCARTAQKAFPQASANDVAFYWKNKRETDIVLITKDNLLGVEVKYQERISKQDFQSLYHFKEGIIASKTMFKTGDEYSVIPVHILLAVL